MENSNQTPQTQQPENPTPNPINSSKSKVIPIVLGIAAVVAIAIGAYLLGTKQSQPVVQNSIQATPTPSPTPTDQTANWKELTFGELNFKVPADWWNEEQKYPTDKFSFININPTKLGRGDAPSAFMIYQHSDITLEQKRTELKKDLTNVNESQVMVAGAQGFLIEGITKDGFLPSHNTRWLVFFYKDIVYSFLELDTKSDLNKYFNQILSTFRFSN